METEVHLSGTKRAHWFSNGKSLSALPIDSFKISMNFID